MRGSSLNGRLRHCASDAVRKLPRQSARETEYVRSKKLLYGLVWRSEFRSEDADPCGVYRYEPNDPEDRSKGYKAIYQYSLKEDFNKFANHEAVHFVEKK